MRKYSGRQWLWPLFSLLIVALTAFHILFVHILLFPKVQPITKTPSDWHLPWKAVSFQVFLPDARGRISAWIIPAKNSSPKWIILLHGRARNRSAVLKFAPGLHASGYSLILPDFPGHGESFPAPVTLGAFEKIVVHSTVGYLQAKGAAKIGILGMSMGGTAAILAAAEDPRIGAVVADSPYQNFVTIVGGRGWKDYKIPSFPFAYTISALAGMLYRFNPFTVDAKHAAARISPRGLYLIHGENDTYVPRRHSEEIYSEARPPREIWIVPGARHSRSFDAFPQEYMHHVLRFFKRHL